MALKATFPRNQITSVSTQTSEPRAAPAQSQARIRVFECACCGGEVAGRPAASCSSCAGNLCLACLGRHAGGKGITKGHAFASPGAEELVALDLEPTAQLCKAHPFEALVLACSTCNSKPERLPRQPLLFCTLCAPEHSGHSIAPVRSAAQVSRDRLAQLLYGLPVSSSLPVGAIPGEIGFVKVARHVARRIATRLTSLPEHADAALAHVAGVRDALFTAITEQAARVSEEIRSVVATKQVAIRDELAAADAELTRAISVSSVLERTLGDDGLSDADIIAHEESLAITLRATAAAVIDLQARSQTSARLEMRPSKDGAFPAPDPARGGFKLESQVDAAVKEAFGELFVEKRFQFGRDLDACGAAYNSTVYSRSFQSLSDY